MANHSTALTAILSLFEMLSGKLLTLDPGSQTALNKLSGHTLGILIEKTDLKITVLFENDHIKLLSYFEDETTTTITGSAQALLKLIFTPATNLYNTGVNITGSTALLFELQKLCENIDIDWESFISQYLGVLPAHGIFEATRSIGNWQHARKNSFTRLLGEYLTEETRAVVSRSELQSFSANVDNLRTSLDRVNARLSLHEAFVLETNKEGL